MHAIKNTSVAQLQSKETLIIPVVETYFRNNKGPGV